MLPVMEGLAGEAARLYEKKKKSCQGMYKDKGYCVGLLWNGSAAEVDGFGRASWVGTDHDGRGSRIG